MSPQVFGNFDLVQRVQLDFTDVVVSRYKSRVTGLSVVHLDYEAPIINGYFVVPTEIFNDSGCPHTLEHLVFMGSEKFPYKGIIDHLANRGFSNGTNAWTDTDHTAYTVSTAGEQGFLQLLPIYVDHILYPTITKAGFVTEVHHLDGKGHDSGVVYSEMQGRENTSGDLMALRMQRLLDPPGSAYRSETGGLMQALRKLTVEQIREYHASYYVPHNLSLIVAGKLSSGTESLLSVVQEQVEPSLIAHGQNHGPKPIGWKRPFVETSSAIRPPISESIKETVEFPEQDESVGELIINFLGPAPNEFLERKALDVITTYLTSSAVAPLNKEYVEIESPLCTYIYFSEDTRSTRVSLPIYVGSVPTEHLDTFDQKLKASLQRIVKEGIDMERMAMVISREERQLRSKLESAKGDTFSGTIITDHIYGAEDGSELGPSMAEFDTYAAVKKWTNKQWTDLLQKYFIDPPSIVVVGRPSAALADKLEKDEKKRLAAQVKKLGPQGLKEAEKVLEAAKAEHDAPIPTDVLTQFKIPSVKSISWIPVQSVQQKGKGRASPTTPATSKLAQTISADGEELPFFLQYDHVESDFVSVHAMFSLEKLPERLRKHISTYLSAFFALPVKRQSGERLSHEEVINKLDNETVSYEIGLGIANSFAETLRITIKNVEVETAAYETAIAWLKDLVYGSEFDKERLAVTIAKIQQSLPEMKRDGNTVLGSLWADLMFSEKSTSRAGGVLPQVDFVPKLAKELQESPDKILADFEEIRKHVTDPSGMRFSVTGNVLKLDKPRSTWAKYFQTPPGVPLSPVPLSSEVLSPVGVNPTKKALVMSLPTIESSYVMHTSRGIKGFDHPQYPAFRVALEVLNATESYLWRYIRGSGLAYGAYVSLDVESGLLTFTLYRSSNSMGAFKEASTVIKGLADGSVALDETTLDAAKSSIVYGVTKTVSTAGRAAIVSFTNQALKGVPQNYQVDLLENFQAVTKDDVLAILRSHFLPLFDAKSSVAVVVTAPSKADDIDAGLAGYGFEVERRTLEIDPNEIDGSESDSDSDSESESDESGLH
ncbi:Metalloenzyme, LuxS/M16 peptidase-like protein [Rhodocollybia butyracea]|uniref:Metalloenzyme, LuxS/M16 peptidase-like protein n=1 Tax=Rhodocollybia butyracea TaxID=206335 RepID=A0A9P5U7M1_9AGAR|nr:Metalloenzyme, LuxS/M16 peptidase-like protein [Rhodocollybia butyracea]